ncbi:MAG: 3-hydroxyacyl-ACP dehydratase FabZ [Dehalococcoidia bacterium]
MPSLSREEIEALIPHREPFIFLDRIIECEFGVRAVGEIDDVSQYQEHVLRGHFPAFPVLPGAIIVEALAEVGAVAALGLPENRGKIAMLTGLDGWKFRHPARPGDKVRLETTLIRSRGRFGKGKGVATIDGKLVAEGEVSFAIVDPPAEFSS